MNLRVVISLLCTYILFSGCSGGYVTHDKYLDDIVGMVSDSPREALSKLDSIDAGTLSDRDRHFYDFLTIKARDKAYIVHDSDSLILTLIDYYSHHQEEGLYPEALYYGGRVYSDLGDSPTALRYFHDALDCISEDNESIDLKSAILSQTGRLLEKWCVYEAAVPYIEEAISLNSIKGDTINLSYNLELLGVIYRYLGQYEKAKECFNKALEANPRSYMAKVHMADIQCVTGHIPEAVQLIGNMIDSVEYDERSYVAATAALIYNKAGLIDSVYSLATQLTQQETNQRIGYYLLTKVEMKDYINPDSIYTYIQGYTSTPEKFRNDILREKILAEETSYNYKRKKRDSNKLIEEYKGFNFSMSGYMIIIIVVITLIIFIFKNKFRLTGFFSTIRIGHSSQEKDLSPEMIDSVLESDSTLHPELSIQENNVTHESNNYSVDKKASLLNKLNESDNNRFYLSEMFVNSEVWQALQDHMSLEKSIPESSDLWQKIEKKIEESSPSFKKDLFVLTDGKLTMDDYHLATLIKCGIPTSKMAILLAKAKNTISTRKNALSRKIFGEKRPLKDIEILIHSL